MSFISFSNSITHSLFILLLLLGTVHCKVVQLTQLQTVTPPALVSIKHKTGPGLESDVTNGYIGAQYEGSHVVLECQAGGAKPHPIIYWKLGRRLRIEQILIRSYVALPIYSNLLSFRKIRNK